MNGVKLTRKELYDLVWKEPISKLALKLGTTDYNLRTLCNKFDTPLPLNGHWMKLQHNKPVVIIPLPKIENDSNQIVFDSDQNQLGNTNALTPLEVLKNQLQNDPDLCFDVPERVTNPDSLIVAAKTFFESKESFKQGKIQSPHVGIISISVSKPLVIRALRLMDTFIKLFKKRGHNVIVSDKSTCVIVFGQSIPIALIEETKKIQRQDGKWPIYDNEPTGNLILKVDESWKSKKYSDGKSRLENRLIDIYARIELLGRELKEREDRWKKEREEQEEKVRNEKRLRELQEGELARFKILLNESHRHHQVGLLRTYIDDVEATLNKKNEEDRFKLEEWIKWARLKVDWYDPMIALDDPLLTEVDQDTLQFKKKNNSYY